jgi:hypothetical protein
MSRTRLAAHINAYTITQHQLHPHVRYRFRRNTTSTWEKIRSVGTGGEHGAYPGSLPAPHMAQDAGGRDDRPLCQRASRVVNAMSIERAPDRSRLSESGEGHSTHHDNASNVSLRHLQCNTTLSCCDNTRREHNYLLFVLTDAPAPKVRHRPMICGCLNSNVTTARAV